LTYLVAFILNGICNEDDHSSDFNGSFKPVGLVTHILKSGQFNLIGLTLHEPVLVTGQLESVNGTVLSDSDVNFSNVLTSGATYILQIVDASNSELNGTVQEITVWSGMTMTTPQDLVAQGLVVGDKYLLRPVITLRDIFGSNNESGLQEGASGIADLVWVPNGSGNYDRYYYHPGSTFPTLVSEGWKSLSAGDGLEAPEVPIFFTDGLLVQRRGATDLDLTITGNVITNNVKVAVFNGFNLISNVYPVGSTLANSSLQANLTSSFTESGADVLWLPDGGGNYTRYFYQRAPLNRWFNATANSAVVDPSAIDLTAGFFVQRRGNAANLNLTPPDVYDDL